MAVNILVRYLITNIKTVIKNEQENSMCIVVVNDR